MTGVDRAITLFITYLQDDEELVAWFATRSDNFIDSVIHRLLSAGEVMPAEYSIGVTDRAYLYVGSDGDCIRHPRSDLQSVGFDRLTVPTRRLVTAVGLGLFLCAFAVMFRTSYPYVSIVLWMAGVSSILLAGVSYNCITTEGIVLFSSETSGGDVVQVPVSSDARESLEQYTTRQDT